jgi:hypothetical protein
LVQSADASFLAVVSGTLIMMPNKLFDYLAGHTVVLNTIRGQAEEILREHGCGWTYGDGDPQACFAAMARVVEDANGRREAVDRARRLAETEFDRAVIYDQMAAFLERVAAGDA